MQYGLVTLGHPPLTPANPHKLSLLPLSPHPIFISFGGWLHNPPGLTRATPVGTVVKLSTGARLIHPELPSLKTMISSSRSLTTANCSLAVAVLLELKVQLWRNLCRLWCWEDPMYATPAVSWWMSEPRHPCKTVWPFSKTKVGYLTLLPMTTPARGLWVAPQYQVGILSCGGSLWIKQKFRLRHNHATIAPWLGTSCLESWNKSIS